MAEKSIKSIIELSDSIFQLKEIAIKQLLATSSASAKISKARGGDLARDFDYEAFGRDLFMYGYSIANNNVFRVI